MQICPENKCTGCYACVNVCSKHCISMQENQYGEVHPVIDEARCIGCKKCINVCPNNMPLEYNDPRACYAAWNTNKEKRKICASGGIGSLMAEYVLTHRQGMTYGAIYDENFVPRIKCVDSICDIEKLKGSKYVQALVGESTFQDVKKTLSEGKFVLFVGTPCQIAGLKSFLKSDYENLITVDLICHGVSPTRYFNEELDGILKRLHLKKDQIENVRFRGNDKNNFFFSVWKKDERKGCYSVYKKSERQNFYLAGFMKGVSLRENCYGCNYARPQRLADITIGDFIGLGNKNVFPYAEKNASSVMVNTEKGEIFYHDFSSIMNELKSVKRNYGERLQYKPSLQIPFPKHAQYTTFRSSYPTYGYSASIKIALSSELRKEQIIYILRRIRSFPKRAAKKIFNFLR